MIHLDPLRPSVGDGRDALTGALDRSNLRRWIEGELRRSLSAKRHVVALYLDFDEYQSIHHRFGRDVGDEVLKGWVRGVSELLGPRDFVARVGDNQLVVVLDREQAPAVDELLCAMRRSVRKGIQLADCAAEFSAGIVVLDATTSFDALLVEGESRMFRARRCWRSMFAAAPEAPVLH